MEWQLVIALVIAIPVILFPVALVWYLNLGGIFTAVKDAKAKKVAQDKGAAVKVEAK